MKTDAYNLYMYGSISLAQTGEEVTENSKGDDKEEEAEHNLQLSEGGVVGGPCKGDVLDAV